jgi:hypothetical protein
MQQKCKTDKKTKRKENKRNDKKCINRFISISFSKQIQFIYLTRNSLFKCNINRRKQFESKNKMSPSDMHDSDDERSDNANSAADAHNRQS